MKRTLLIGIATIAASSLLAVVGFWLYLVIRQALSSEMVFERQLSDGGV